MEQIPVRVRPSRFSQSVVAVTGWLDAKRYFTALSILSRSCPIMFLFIGTYFQGRFAFYDVLMKRGLFFLVAQTSLTLCFVPLAPLSQRPIGISRL